MKGRNPTKKEKEWMDMISQIGCVVCKKFLDCFSPAEVHHIKGQSPRHILKQFHYVLGITERVLIMKLMYQDILLKTSLLIDMEAKNLYWSTQ